MDEKLQKYYDYLKAQGAYVPDTYESFRQGLSTDEGAKKYHDYALQNGYYAPQNYDEFAMSLGVGSYSSSTFSPTTPVNKNMGALDNTRPEKYTLPTQQVFDNLSQIYSPKEKTMEGVSNPLSAKLAETGQTLDNNEDKKIAEQNLKAAGYDPSELQDNFGNLSPEVKAQLDVNKLMQMKETNPVQYKSAVAGVQVQDDFLKGLKEYQQSNPNENTQAVFQQVQQMMGKAPTSYAETLQNLNQLSAYAKKYTNNGDEVAAKLGQYYTSGFDGLLPDTDAVIAADPRSKYFSRNQMLALQKMDYTNPGMAQAFKNLELNIDTKNLPADTQTGLQYRQRDLDYMGIQQRMDGISQKMNEISNNPAPTDEDKATYQKLSEQYDAAKTDAAGINKKYPLAALTDANGVAQELLGESHNGLARFMNTMGIDVANVAVSIPELIMGGKSFFTGQGQNDYLLQLRALGMSKRNELETYTTIDKQMQQAFRVDVNPEFQKTVDGIKADESLTLDEKTKKLAQLIADNPDSAVKTAITPKLNITARSVWNGTTEFGAHLPVFIAGGELGMAAGLGSKLSTFGTIMLTSLQQDAAARVEAGDPNPFGNAIISQGINAAVFAGVDKVGEIRKLYSPTTAVGKIISGLDDATIKKFLDNPPTAMQTFWNGLGKSAKDGLATSIKLSLAGTAGSVANKALAGQHIDPEELGKELALSTISQFAVNALTSGLGQIRSGNISNLYHVAHNGDYYREQINQMVESGRLTPEAGDKHKAVLDNVREAYDNTPTKDNDEKQLSDRQLLAGFKANLEKNQLARDIESPLPTKLREKKEAELESVQKNEDLIYSTDDELTSRKVEIEKQLQPKPDTAGGKASGTEKNDELNNELNSINVELKARNISEPIIATEPKAETSTAVAPESNTETHPQKTGGRFAALAKKNEQPTVESAVIEINGKQYEGKNHAEAILKAKADGQDISNVDRKAEGKFKLSDGTIIDRSEAEKQFGNSRAEVLIQQDEAAKQADKDYGNPKANEPKGNESPTNIDEQKQQPPIQEKQAETSPTESVQPAKKEGGGVGGDVEMELKVQSNKVEDILGLSGEDSDALSIIHNADLTPTEKQILWRQYKRGVMNLNDVKNYSGVLDIDKLNSEDIGKWARTALEKQKSKSGKFNAENIDFEEVKNSTQQPTDVSKEEGSDVKKRNRIIQNHLLDNEGDVDGAFGAAGYVNVNGIWVAPEAVEYAKKVSPKVWQQLKDKGIKYLEGGDDGRGLQKTISYDNKNIRGIGVNENVGDSHSGHDHTMLHETAHHVWQEELTPEQKAVFNDDNPVSDYAKSVKDGKEKTLAKHDEEDFAELYAKNNGDIDAAIAEKKAQSTSTQEVKDNNKPTISKEQPTDAPKVENNPPKEEAPIVKDNSESLKSNKNETGNNDSAASETNQQGEGIAAIENKAKNAESSGNAEDAKNVVSEVDKQIEAVTLSGLTETEKQAEIERRKKETKSNERQFQVNDLLQKTEAYNRLQNGRLGKSKPEGLKLLNEIRLKASELGLDTKHIPGKALFIQKGAENGRTVKVRADNRADGNKSLVENPETAKLENRTPEVQDLFKLLYYEGDALPVSVNGSNGRLSKAQLNSAYEDVANGVHSKQAKELLDTIEKAIENDAMDFHAPDMQDWHMSIDDVKTSLSMDAFKDVENAEKNDQKIRHEEGDDYVPFQVKSESNNAELNTAKQIIKEMQDEAAAEDKHITLQDIQKEAARDGIDPDLIEKAYNEQGKETKIADTDNKGKAIPNELTTSFAKRVNNFVDKIFGKSKSGEGHTVVLKDSKALEDAAKELNARYQVDDIWHGSPHDFDKFSLDKIGTGEGAQAFGHGLYFTDLKGVAENYADKLSPTQVIIDGKIAKRGDDFELYRAAYDIASLGYNRALEKNKELADENFFDKITSDKIIHYLDQLKDKDVKLSKERKVYKVTLHEGKTPEQYNWLEWDKSPSRSIEQKVQEQFNKEFPTKVDYYGKPIDLKSQYYKDSRGQVFQFEDSAKGGEKLYRSLSMLLGGDKAASDFLLRAGIDGVKYPAESIARGANSDNARGHNYVVFDDKAVSIKEKIQFQKNDKGEILGFTDPTTGKIYLNGEKLNPNTPVHEAGHLWTSWAKENAPELHKRGLELTDKSKYLRDVKANEFYKKEALKAASTPENISLAKKAGEAGSKEYNSALESSKEYNDYMREEALSTAIGDKGAQFVTEARRKAFADWAKDLWNNVAKAVGFKNVSAKEIQDMTLDEFSKRAAADILKGEPQKINENNNAGSGKEPPVEKGNAEPDESANPQRSFTKQILKDESILPKDEIAKKLDYVRKTNAVTVAEAAKIIKDIGVEEAFNAVTNDRDIHPAVRVVMGEMLIKKFNDLAAKADNEADKNYFIDKTIATADYVSEKLGTEAGQAIQAFSLYARLTPEGQLRAATKEAKAQSKSKIEKSRKDATVITEKLQKVNEEVANEITKSQRVKSSIDRAEKNRVERAKDKIQKAREKREQIIKKYQTEKGKTLYSTVGLTTEGIEFVGNIAKTYIDEGVANLEILAEKIRQSLKAATNKDIDDITNKHIYDVIKPLVEVAENTKTAKSLKELEKDIHKVIREHYTVPEEAKTTLINKFMDAVGLEEPEATKLAKEIQSEFDRIATRRKMQMLESEKARFDKMQNKLAGAKKTEQKTLQSEAIRLSNMGALDSDTLLDMVAEKLGTGHLTPEQGKEIQRLAEIVAKAPEGSPKNNAVEDLLTYRAKMKGTNWGEVTQGVWYANVLSGYLTHVKNIVSTAMNGLAFFATEVASDPKSLPVLLYGGARGLKRGGVEAWHTITTGKSPIHVSKVELPNILERIKFKGGLLNPANYLKYVGRLMVGEDVFQFQGLKEMRATQLAYREAQKNGYKNPFSRQTWRQINDRLLITHERFLDADAQVKQEGLKGIDAKRRIYELMEQSRPIKMQEDAYGFAAKGTFNHNTEGTLGALTTGISQLLDVQVAGTRPLRFLIPFTRIITNVANNTLDFSPIGMVRAARGVRGFEGFTKSRIVKDQYHVMTTEERRQTVVKASLGIVSMAALYALSKNGTIQITGAGPSDIKKKIQLMQEGWQEYSIKVGDRYYSYKLSPMVFAWGIVGSIRDHENYDKGADEETALQRTTLAAWSGIKNIGDMTWVSSASPIMSALSSNNPSQAGYLLSNTGRSMGKSFIVPNAFTQSAQAVQNIFDMPQKQVNNAYQNLIMDVPIARNTMNDKINALGDPIVKDNDLIYSNETKDPVLKYLLDKKGWVAPVNKNTLIIFDQKTKEDRPATEDEYYNFSKLRGSKIKAALQDILKNGAEVKKINDDKSFEYVHKTAEELTTKELNSLLDPIKTDATKKAKAELFNGANGEF